MPHKDKHTKALQFICAGAIVPVTVATVRDLSTFGKHYHDEYWDLVEICYKAIRSGDWIVDGACDPDRHIRKFKQMEDETF